MNCHKRCKECSDWEATGAEDFTNIYNRIKEKEGFSMIDLADDLFTIENVIYVCLRALQAEKEYNSEKIADTLMFNVIKPLEKIRKGLCK